MNDGFGIKDIEYVARLARLKLSDSEKQYFASDLDGILKYVRKLNELDTDKVEPLAHVLPLKNVLREDRVKSSLPVDDVLANAPKKGDGMFRVPRVIEE